MAFPMAHTIGVEQERNWIRRKIQSTCAPGEVTAHQYQVSFFSSLITFMRDNRNIFLIGPMGSGKTAVGRRLARTLCRSFYDSDVEIERRMGVSISRIFERDGESGFRHRECEVIESLTDMENIVLATGGGAVVLPESRLALCTRGCVVYLQTSVAQQTSRVANSRNRPMLATVADTAARLDQLMIMRAPMYEEIADIVVPTDGRHVYEVVNRVLTALAALRGKSR